MWVESDKDTKIILILRKTCFHFILRRTRVSNQRLIQLSNFHYCWFQSSIFFMQTYSKLIYL